ncbi:MAG: hypothetical protein ACE5E6_04040 [Phycisphaerae bacterium]
MARRDAGVEHYGVVRVMLVLLVGMLAIPTAGRVLRIVADFPSAVELTYPASVDVYVAREFQHGRPIYRDFREPPHVPALYGPLLYVAPGVVARLVAADELGIFKIGRAMCLLSTAGALVIVGVLVYRYFGAGWWITLLMVGLLATAKIMWPWGMSFRADAPELFLDLAGLAIFMRWKHDQRRYAAVAAFVLAFAFKQSAVVGPVAVVLSMWLGGRRRDALWFAGVAAAAYGGAFLVMNALTDGLYFMNGYRGMAANVTPGNLATVVAGGALVKCGAPLALGAVGALRSWQTRRPDVVSVFFALAFLAACAGTVRDGSGDNYFIKPLALACILGGREIARWLGRCDAATGGELSGCTAHADATTATDAAARRSSAPAIVALLFLLVYVTPPAAARLVVGYGGLMDRVAGRRALSDAQLAFLRGSAARLDALGGPVVCEDASLALYCRNALMMDTLTLTGLADQGVFDDTAVVAMIRSRTLAAVVLKRPLARGEVRKYQSTDWVRRAWLDAMADAGYEPLPDGPRYTYVPPR